MTLQHRRSSNDRPRGFVLAPSEQGTDPGPRADRKVVVLGAGPAGLAAAHELATRGTAVEVLEKNDYVGGLCRTVEHEGFRFDLGGHRWFTQDRELHAWFLELMRGELVEVRRTSRILFGGKYYDYPISLRNVFRNTGPLGSAHIALSYARAELLRLVRRREPGNLEEAFTDQFGRRLFEMFFQGYSEKVWGKSCREVSADWVEQRSKGLSVLGVLRDRLSRRSRVVSLVDRFVYPRLGYQRICDRMREDIEHRGGVIRCGSPVQSLECAETGGFRVHVESAGGGRVVQCGRVISTLPLPHLVEMLVPASDPSLVALARSLRFRDLITVTVLLRKDRVTPDTWLYVHDDEVIFARLHEPKNWSPDMVPGPEFTSLVCECFCSVGDATWSLSDADLGRRVVDDLADPLGLVSRDEVQGVRVIRTRFAYPVYDLDYGDKVRTLLDAVADYPGLHCVGRGGTFRYNNADHSIEMGLRIARRILGESADPMEVNSDRGYHEEIRDTATSAAPVSREEGRG